MEMCRARFCLFAFAVSLWGYVWGGEMWIGVSREAPQQVKARELGEFFFFFCFFRL